jgi:hypothetical protein
MIQDYISGKEVPAYSVHWVYRAVEEGKVSFKKFPFARSEEVIQCYRQIADACGDFKFLNSDLVHEVFGGTDAVINEANVILALHIPQPYDAMVRRHEGKEYIIIDIGNFCEYVKAGHDAGYLVQSFLTHELIHLLIGSKFPPGEGLAYIEKLNYIAFDEGFAHLMSYRDNIAEYKPEEGLDVKFRTAKARFEIALKEENPLIQERFLSEANSGKYWNKFAAVSSMLYLMKNIKHLKIIYETGWRGYTNQIFR